MSDRNEAGALSIAIRIDEPALAARLAALLRQVPELRVASADEPSDLILSTGIAAKPASI